jgi:hypothetical protein
MQDLIDKLEKASGPDRELDAEIVVSLNIKPHWLKLAPGRMWIDKSTLITIRFTDAEMRKGRGNPAAYCQSEIPQYTGSIDAAMALVPRGWIVEIHRGFNDDGEYWSRVILVDSFSIERGSDITDRREVMSHGEGEPPRFIAAAALKARESNDRT